MRRLLLLLLTFLLPLQLLAATVGDLPSRAEVAQSFAGVLSVTWEPGPAALSGPVLHDIALVADATEKKLAVSMNAVFDTELPQPPLYAVDQPVGDDDSDFPTSQVECEDHTMPARIATPDAVWQPFPHLFTAPLSWPSFVRDQLRPPPLA
ncbi:hypothetical protein [Herbaspirillum chlorophenolicum]|uniref:hypothetical protein n=1 Tax=Herbaspirillum chlorophenolicum TaxID=211589 RepID=UPI00067D7C8E|nr:hypothetical protein [Herbaspirillum chlorophenolicum]